MMANDFYASLGRGVDFPEEIQGPAAGTTLLQPGGGYVTYAPPGYITPPTVVEPKEMVIRPPIAEAGIPGLAALWGLLAPVLGKIAPWALGGATGALAAGGIFGDEPVSGPQGGTPGERGPAGGLQFPWETAPGAGMIAPWTTQFVGPTGKIYQKGVPLAQPVQITPGEWILKWWTNASAQYGLPATVAFYKTNRRVFYRNLITGEWGTFRAKKNIVLSSDPRMSHVRKFHRANKKLTKMLKKVAK